MFRKKKRERELQTPTLPEVENEQASSPTTPDPQVSVGACEANEKSESVKPSSKCEGSTQSSEQEQQKEVASTPGEKPSPHSERRQLQQSHSGTSIGKSSHSEESSLGYIMLA